MKKNFVKILFVLAVVLFGGISVANAASSLPSKVVSDNYKEVEYIKNFPVIYKTTDGGKHVVYCMNMSATYDGGITFTKTGKVDQGFIYILKNKPNTSNKEKDFYITQMAVWYYEDYLNNNNFNLEVNVKQYILAHKDSEDVSKKIYNLYYGARDYKEKAGSLSIKKEGIVFTIENGYYVSNEIAVSAKNLSSDVKYTLSNVPGGSQVLKTTNGVKVRVPADKIPEGKQLTFTLNATTNYDKHTAYYYFYNNKYQKVLYEDTLDETVGLSDSVTMVLRHEKENFDVKISKMDVTQSKEVPGATLVIKDANGNVVETWVSTNETHKTVLKAGKYSLTETIAPKGYKLSSTTIYFQVDTTGGVSVKNELGNYVKVDKVVMINELVDVVSFAKRDSKTNALLAGATLVIKDANGNVVKEFVTTNNVYQTSLDAGEYTLSEKSAPVGYILSDQVVKFALLTDGTLKVMTDEGKYVDAVMINYYNHPDETTDEFDVTFAKRDSKTNALLAGATLVLKDATGAVVKEFVTTNDLYKLSLKPGEYTLSEKSAPAGYKLSSEVIKFALLTDGKIKIMNNEGTYVDSVIITYYNAPVDVPQEVIENQEVKVPATGKTVTLSIIAGIALLIGGIYSVKKTIEER